VNVDYPDEWLPSNVTWPGSRPEAWWRHKEWDRRTWPALPWCDLSWTPTAPSGHRSWRNPEGLEERTERRHLVKLEGKVE